MLRAVQTGAIALFACAALLLPSLARADVPLCRTVELTLKPVPHVQMAVWIEDQAGNYIDTIYVTRLTGTLGLANRPGLPGFKSDYRFPYGAREMVMPVWAHKRNHLYGKVVMGGAKLDGTRMRIGDTTDCGSDCRNDTIGYHFNVSSPEPFYCGPSGGTGGAALDATSCASGFYGSKGAYLNGAYSYYPPRADLTGFQRDHDSMAAEGYAAANDLGAVSGATPPGNAIIDPPIRWTPPGDGQYVMKVEVSKEFDFNMYHEHPPTPDGSPELQSFGLEDPGNSHFGSPGFKYGLGGFGQPSIVYAVPFTVGPNLDVETSSSYVGYGDWDGASGTMHPTDLTITDGVDGTGVGRLLMASDGSGSWRLKVRAAPECGPSSGDGGTMCTAPAAPTNLVLSAHDTSIDLQFASAITGAGATRFDVRYRENAPITDADFTSAIPPSTPPPSPGPPGTTVSMSITGLRPELTYFVGVRAISMCDSASAISSAGTVTTRQKFVTLHGCFIATAAYGTPVAKELDALRGLRDRYLVTNTLGRVFVGTYYAFSPPAAAAISRDETLRGAARVLVAPLVRLASALERAEARLPRRRLAH
jgi:hypothetical protein